MDEQSTALHFVRTLDEAREPIDGARKTGSRTAAACPAGCIEMLERTI